MNALLPRILQPWPPRAGFQPRGEAGITDCPPPASHTPSSLFQGGRQTLLHPRPPSPDASVSADSGEGRGSLCPAGSRAARLRSPRASRAPARSSPPRAPADKGAPRPLTLLPLASGRGCRPGWGPGQRCGRQKPRSRRSLEQRRVPSVSS